MWGDEAAERAEMDQPMDPLREDGSPRLPTRKPCDHENFTTEPNRQGSGVCRDCGAVL